MSTNRIQGGFPVRPVVPNTIGTPQPIGNTTPSSGRSDQYVVGSNPRLPQPGFRTSYFGGLTASEQRFDAALPRALSGDRGEGVSLVEKHVREVLRG